MPWLRIDDNETEHPKVIGLIELAGYEAYYRLHRLRGYCARLRTGGHFTRAAAKEIGVKPKMLEAMVRVGLVDDFDGDLGVHDWAEYNPSDATAAERMRRHRQNSKRPATNKWLKTRDAVYNRDAGVCVDCGKVDQRWNADHEPDRGDLEATGRSIYDLAFIVTRCQSCHSKKTRREANQDRTKTEPSRNVAVTKSEPRRNGYGSSRVSARARPVPQPQPIVQVPVEEGSTVALNPARENGNSPQQEIPTNERDRRRKTIDRSLREAS